MSEGNVDATTNSVTKKRKPATQLYSPLDEATNLLINWQLPQLCNKFRDEEVCAIAFEHLTEADISELIPKVGPRSIFRARLSQWRQQQQDRDVKSSNDHIEKRKRDFQTAFGNSSSNNNTKNDNHIFVEPPMVKLETGDADENWLSSVENLQTGPEDESLVDASAASTSSSGQEYAHDLDTLNDGDILAEEPKDSSNNSLNCNADMLVCTHNHDTVNVQKILSNSFDGRKAIEFYATTQMLDNNQRKKIIKIIIAVVLEMRIAMSADCFHDLARQLVEIFPSENYETYYVPRIGNTCPKGALYNKYLNMGKRLRREGLLEYRVNRHRVNNKWDESQNTS